MNVPLVQNMQGQYAQGQYQPVYPHAAPLPTTLVPAPPAPAEPGRGGAIVRFLAAHKSPIAAFLVVAVVLVWLLPRITRYPRLATFEGKPNVLGIALAAAAAAVAHAIVVALPPHPPRAA